MTIIGLVFFYLSHISNILTTALLGFDQPQVKIPFFISFLRLCGTFFKIWSICWNVCTCIVFLFIFFSTTHIYSSLRTNTMYLASFWVGTYHYWITFHPIFPIFFYRNLYWFKLVTVPGFPQLLFLALCRK